MTSVYWAVVTFTTIGYGDVTPVSDNERAFTLCTAILGALLFGYMIGEICRLMSSFGHKQDLKFRTMAHLHNFTTERGLPRSLNQALTKFFLFKAECDDYDVRLPPPPPPTPEKQHPSLATYFSLSPSLVAHGTPSSPFAPLLASPSKGSPWNPRFGVPVQNISASVTWICIASTARFRV